MGDRTVVDLFLTSIADIRSPVQAAASFAFKVLAGLVAGRAGSTLDITKDDLATYIRFPTAIPTDTEVMGIIESAFMIPVGHPMGPDLFGDRSGILAEEACDIFKRAILIQRPFNKQTILKG